MDARDPELRKELDATLHVRRELGPEYESELVDSFLERLDGAVDRRVRRQLAEQQMVVARGSRPPRAQGDSDSFGERFGFGIVSMILAVPLSAIGSANAGFAGLVVSWLGIVGVNAVHASGRAPWSRERPRSGRADGHPGGDWDG
ncbi:MULTISPECIES: hypothetical protein [Streptomyces]|uniref:Integral membrane protein n=1 Tax=Streptomyces lycii TaxID=2654337 RepID=A0ABQ7FMI0_9ACTN|nr:MULTISPECIES: hypothetical protein [Streptomyces]KAF4408443.1 hypothetical protein GCU69_14230 [Streptomyces lycii]PGH50035.1 hypothetical protein CRI70_14295 [Streptomyces sp. Ru87]